MALERAIDGQLATLLTMLLAITKTESVCDRSMLAVPNNANLVNRAKPIPMFSNTTTNNNSNNHQRNSDTSDSNSTIETFLEDHEFDYQCHQSYTAIGTPRFTCKNGSFIGNFQCIRTNCSSLDSPLHGKVVDISVSNNVTKVTFHCDSNYYMVDQPTLECGPDGQWNPSSPPICNALECGGYPHRRHGNVSHTIYNDPAGYITFAFELHCHPDAILHGLEITSCTADGEWHPGKLGSCKQFTHCPVTMGLSNNIDRGFLMKIGGGIKYDYICKNDTSISQVGTSIDCYDNGTWSNPVAGCYRNCKIDEQLNTQNGVVFNNLTTNQLFLLHGQSVHWACKDGYKANTINMPDIITCYNGELNTFPACIIVDHTTMGTINNITNATIIKKEPPPRNKHDASNKPWIYALVPTVVVLTICLVVVYLRCCRQNHAQRRQNQQQEMRQAQNGYGLNSDVDSDLNRPDDVDSSNGVDMTRPFIQQNTCVRDETEITRSSYSNNQNSHHSIINCKVQASDEQGPHSQDELHDGEIILDGPHSNPSTEGHTDDVLDGAAFVDGPRTSDTKSSGSNTESGWDEEHSRYKVSEKSLGKFKRENKSKSRYETAKDWSHGPDHNCESKNESDNENTAHDDTSTANLLGDSLPKIKTRERNGPRSQFLTDKEWEIQGEPEAESGNDTDTQGNTSTTKLLVDCSPRSETKRRKRDKIYNFYKVDDTGKDEGQHPELPVHEDKDNYTCEIPNKVKCKGKRNRKNEDRYKTAAVSPEDIDLISYDNESDSCDVSDTDS